MSFKTPRFSWLVYVNNFVFSTIYRYTRRNYKIWHYLARNYHPILSKFAYFNSCSMCDFASYNVPAYKKYLALKKSKVNYWDFDLLQYPETNKKDYIKAYSFADRCKFGVIPSTNTTIDESSGSTGKPYNWVRTIDELRDVHTISANYIRMEVCQKNEKLITLNAFSMGSWATGINMTLGMLPISIVKSIGPDIDKIIDTLETFKSTKEGGYSYLVCGYPPFVKNLVEEMLKRKFPIEDYKLYAVVGGEGMTEAMRDYLEKYFLKVRSGYGATDIQLGVGGETDFTIWVRKELIKNPALRLALLGEKENRTPMLFHYNPMDHFIETNSKDEIIISINNFKVLSPRLRYNLEDEGKVYEYEEFVNKLVECGYTRTEIKKVSKHNPIKMPLVLMYGRKDGTISYMGANIYPQDVEQGIYTSEYADKIANFKISLNEQKDLSLEPTINIELKEGIELITAEKYREDIATKVREYMMQVNRDFEESVKEDANTGNIQIEFFLPNQGPFANRDSKMIKNKYI
jgi:phenylacetate-CoA ligase